MKKEVYLKRIGDNITRIRKSRGFTSKELGYRCDIDKSALIHIEKGRINVTVNTLIKIAEALEVEVIDFFKLYKVASTSKKEIMGKTVQSKTSTFKIGGILEVNRIGYGAMQLTGKGVWGDPENRLSAKKVLQAVVENGINFIDTADAYGPNTNETLIREALYPYKPGLIIATKGGLVRTGPSEWKVNGHPKHIKEAIDGSLKRLKLERIDLWQLHRIDPTIPVSETLGPVSDAVKAGKIRFVGLSEVDVKQIKEAEKTISLVSVQNLYNLSERKWEEVVDYTAKKENCFYSLVSSGIRA